MSTCVHADTKESTEKYDFDFCCSCWRNVTEIIIINHVLRMSFISPGTLIFQIRDRNEGILILLFHIFADNFNFK